jgi:hypothetical protein
MQAPLGFDTWGFLTARPKVDLIVYPKIEH